MGEVEVTDIVVQLYREHICDGGACRFVWIAEIWYPDSDEPSDEFSYPSYDEALHTALEWCACRNAELWVE